MGIRCQALSGSNVCDFQPLIASELFDKMQSRRPAQAATALRHLKLLIGYGILVILITQPQDGGLILISTLADTHVRYVRC
jgi:hypothetical protein